MDSLYYKDTKSAIEDLSEEDFSFLNKDLQRTVSTAISEVESFLDYFGEVVTEREKVVDAALALYEYKGGLGLSSRKKFCEKLYDSGMLCFKDMS